MAHRCVAGNISVSCRSLAVEGARAVTTGVQSPSETAHLGEVSVTVWPQILKEMCTRHNIHVLE